MQMDNADRFVVIKNKQLGNAFAGVVHNVNGFRYQNVRSGCFRITGHDFRNIFAKHIGRNAAAEIAVRDNAPAVRRYHW